MSLHSHSERSDFNSLVRNLRDGRTGAYSQLLNHMDIAVNKGCLDELMVNCDKNLLKEIQSRLTEILELQARVSELDRAILKVEIRSYGIQLHSREKQVKTYTKRLLLADNEKIKNNLRH